MSKSDILIHFSWDQNNLPDSCGNRDFMRWNTSTHRRIMELSQKLGGSLLRAKKCCYENLEIALFHIYERTNLKSLCSSRANILSG